MPKASGFRFTREKVRELKPREQAYLVFDTSHKGLGVRVYPSGAKVFVQRYRLSYKGHLRTLGWFDKLADAIAAWEKARDEVNAVRHQRADGVDVPDPMVTRKEKATTLAAAMSIADGVNEYLRVRRREHERRSAGKTTAGPGLRESTAGTYERALRADLLKHARIKGKTLAQVTRADVIDPGGGKLNGTDYAT